MNKEWNILIQSLDQGYLVTDNSEAKQYAALTLEEVINIIKVTAGVTTPQPAQEAGAPAHIHQESEYLIPKFGYDPAQEKEIKEYTNMSVVEMTDGRAVVIYQGAHYYTTKEKIMQIPYPVPYKYLAGRVLSTTGAMCLRAYRHHLATISAEKLDQNVETGDERTEKLKETAEVNKERWKHKEDKLKKTAALREMAIKMGVQ